MSKKDYLYSQRVELNKNKFDSRSQNRPLSTALQLQHHLLQLKLMANLYGINFPEKELSEGLKQMGITDEEYRSMSLNLKIAILLILLVGLLTSCGLNSTNTVPIPHSFPVPVEIPPPIPFLPPMVAIPIPDEFLPHSGQISYVKDYDNATESSQAGEQVGNMQPTPEGNSCKSYPFDNDVRSTMYYDRTDNTITRLYQTAGGEPIGYYQAAVTKIGGRDVIIQWVEVNAKFARMGYATGMLENMVDDVGRTFGSKYPITFADKNGLGYTRFWGNNSLDGYIDDNGDKLPYTNYKIDRVACKTPPPPGNGEQQFSDPSMWQAPASPSMPGVIIDTKT